MLSPELVQLAVIALMALAVGGVVYVLIMPLLGEERRTSQRFATAAQGQARQVARKVVQPLQMRKKQVQDTIREIEAREKARRRVTLRLKLLRAGLPITPRTYYIASALAGLFVFLFVLVTGSSLIVSALAGIAAGFGLPRWIVARLARRRQEKFLVEFANAVEIIVRGIKSGLPLTDCLQLIAAEAPEPVKGEFVDLVEQQRVGVPLSQAFERIYERMPLQEVNFFAIVIAIQQQTGGNLAEALSNLAQVLRDRYRLAAKVRIFSAEAKASAMIIGALPLCVLGAVYLTNPAYISLLWTESLGNVMLIASGIWMLIGVLVMRKMINFDY